MLNSFLDNKEIYLHLLSFLSTEMAQVLEIFPCGRQGPVYPAYSQYHGCWFPGSLCRHAIHSNGIDFVIPEYSIFSTTRVKKFGILPIKIKISLYISERLSALVFQHGGARTFALHVYQETSEPTHSNFIGAPNCLLVIGWDHSVHCHAIFDEDFMT